MSNLWQRCSEGRGQIAFVLHAHLPYVPPGSTLEGRWLLEAMLESYLPILGVFDRLAAEGVAFAVTVGLTPTLLEQLKDAGLPTRFESFLAHHVALVAAEGRRSGPSGPLEFLAGRAREVRGIVERHGDLLSGFVAHARAGRLDLIASAATHAFLPALPHRDVTAQVRIGKEVFRHRR